MSASLEIKFDKLQKIYYEEDIVKGNVIVNNPSSSPLAYQSLSISVEGIASLTLSAKSVGRLEALYNSVKPITVFSYSAEIATQNNLLTFRSPNYRRASLEKAKVQMDKQVSEGNSKIPFKFHLSPKGSNKILYETYHGVFINIQYIVKCIMKRPLLSKDLVKEAEFFVEYKRGDQAQAKPKEFTINPNSIANINMKTSIPRFSIRGILDSSLCCVTRPLTGELTVESADTDIRSIELQLIRVETVGCTEGYAKESSEIQNIEIGTGNVCRGLPIPMYMVFPRLFSCPTLETTNFKIEFELNIVVVFQDDRLIMESFPLKLTRF